jgi:hypothetical protein
VRRGEQRPRLSCLPQGAVSSAGEEAAEFAETCGLFLDPWQRWCLDQMLSERADGAWAATLVLLLLPRQNGKNSVLEALELAALYLFDEPRIIHTAHLQKTSADHMERMVALVKSNEDLERVTKFYFANGKEAMRRTDNGGRIEFITRGKKTGRGGSPTRVIFDEALYLSDEQIQAILPSLSAQSMNADGPPQMIYTSSAPLPDSLLLHRVRDRGLSGDARSMFYAEWGCELGVDPDDRDLWYEANPGLGIRISEEWVEENELAILTPDAFAIERLGVVFPPVSEAKDVKIPADKWQATVSAATLAGAGEVSLSFAVSRDGGWSSVAIAAGSIVDPYVEVVDHRQGVGWLPGRLVELVERWSPLAVGFNNAGPAAAQAAAVLAAFRDAGIDAGLLVPMNTAEYKSACGGIYTDIVEGRLKRPDGQGPLDVAVADAAERPLGDAWAWDMRNATVPISPLEAVTVARALLPVEAVVSAPVFAY